MNYHTQPKNSLLIIVRLDGDELEPLLIPLQLLPQLPAIVQARLFQAQAPALMKQESQDAD